MKGEPATRVAFLDAYRALLVLAVISLHGAMTYMAYPPAWWYVIHPGGGLLFLLWVLIADTFPMAALFFVSGYFAPASLARKGRGAFLRDKALRIGLPWVAGVLLIAPLFARATWRSLGLPLPPSYGEFVRTVWLGPGYQQAHFWFLGVLLAFFLLFALVGPSFLRPPSPHRSPLGSLALWWGLSSGAFFLSCLRWHPDLWIPLGPFYFQPARIVSYLGAFLLGQRAWLDGWFARPAPGGASLALSALAASASVLPVVLIPLRLSQGQSLYLRAAQAVAYSSAALFMGLFLLLLCQALLNRPSPMGQFLGQASFGVYWLHQMILMPLAALLIPFDLPLAVKFALGLALTYGLSLALTAAILRRLPLLRRIF